MGLVQRLRDDESLDGLARPRSAPRLSISVLSSAFSHAHRPVSVAAVFASQSAPRRRFAFFARSFRFSPAFACLALCARARARPDDGGSSCAHRGRMRAPRSSRSRLISNGDAFKGQSAAAVLRISFGEFLCSRNGAARLHEQSEPIRNETKKAASMCQWKTDTELY